MLKFNLLPKEKKEKVEKEMNLLLLIGFLRALFLAFFILFVLILTFYFSTIYILNSQKNLSAQVKGNPKLKEILSKENEITEMNQTLDLVLKTQSKIIYLAPVVEEISSIIPQNVYLTDLIIERKIEGQQSSNNPSGQENTAKEVTSTPIQTPPTATSLESQQKKEYIEINIKGVAKEREGVILLEKAIREKKEFFDIVPPATNLLEPTNANFEFTFKLNYESKNK